MVGKGRASHKKCQIRLKNNWLISINHLCMVRAMAKIIVLAVSIIWASLLLISWSGAEDIARTPAAPAAAGNSL